MKKSSFWNKNKGAISFVLITVIVLLMCDIADVIHYYVNKSEYTEYEGMITDFETTGRRYKNYYCTVEYYDENGTYCINDSIYKEYGDKEGDLITFYTTDDGRIYRKGYIKYMSHMRISIIYGIYLISSVVGIINRIRENRKDNMTDKLKKRTHESDV